MMTGSRINRRANLNNPQDENKERNQARTGHADRYKSDAARRACKSETPITALRHVSYRRAGQLHEFVAAARNTPDAKTRQQPRPAKDQAKAESRL